MFTTKSTFLSRDINRIITDMATTLGSTFNPKFAKVVERIFAKGEQGFFYDPFDLKTQYQDAAGATAVNATGQPLGLVLDKSKGLSVGSNISSKSAETKTDDVAKYINLISNASYAFKWFDVEFTINSISAPNTIFIEGSGGGTFLYFTNLLLGTNKIKLLTGSSGSIRLGALLGSRYDISNITVKELSGNHAYQTTSAARPILRSIPILGTEVIADPEFNDPSYWNVSATGSTSVSGGFARFNAAPTGNNVNRSNVITLGKTYLFEIRITSITQGALRLSIGLGTGSSSSQDFRSAGVYSFIGTAAKTGIPTIQITSIGDATATVDRISVKEVLGYKTNNFIEYDGVDDKLITNLPSELTNCTVLRAVPNVGTQVKYNQTLPMLYEDSTNHAGLLAINRALTYKEQVRLMEELDKRAGATSLETLTFKTFDNNQEGFVYDPNDLSTMFQDAAGTTPVTGTGQPVGLVLDKSKWLTLGNECTVNGNFDDLSNWLNVGAPTKSVQNGVLRLEAVSGTGGLYQDILLPKHGTCKVVIRARKVSGSSVVRLSLMPRTGSFSLPNSYIDVTSVNFTDHILFITKESAANGIRVYLQVFSGDAVLEVDSVSVKELAGNHAYQTASSSRPILRQNAVTGAYFLEFDGSDDFLQTNNIDFTGTDKVSLLASVNVPPGASTGCVAEVGTSAQSINGSFGLFKGPSTLQWASRGTSGVLGAQYGTPVYPDVLCAKAAINSSLLTVRRNAILSIDDKRTQGTGNYGSYPLYIGRRAGTSLPFAGHIYGLIGIGKVVTDNETAAIEKELAKRVGVTLNV